MEKANNMMTDNDMMCWHALYTAPKSEHKLMQRLNAAGYTTYCPMQAVFVKWKGHTRKVITPLFSGCLFVAGNVSEVTSLASSQKAAILVDNEGKSLSIEAGKAELPAKFAQLLKLITEELLDTVTSQAKENSRLRMNYNFHASMDAPIHRLLNALEPGTYLPPHRHTDKEETYLVLRGSLLAFFYDDAGNVTDKVCLNPSEGKYGLEIPSNTWHSIIALESGTVIFEIKKGPYQPLPSEDLASWAPQTSDTEGIKAFMKRMLEL